MRMRTHKFNIEHVHPCDREDLREMAAYSVSEILAYNSEEEESENLLTRTPPRSTRKRYMDRFGCEYVREMCTDCKLLSPVPHDHRYL